MLDMPTAMRVTDKCVRKVAKLFPPKQIDPNSDLLSIGINNTRIDLLKKTIATDKNIGLPSLQPPFKIDQNLLTMDETSTFFDVFTMILNNAVRA